ncbi:hypothetical protein, partial [Pseudomonas psychrophila]|uniref:hypothetical protein n=1 Tax=Pseudomonas psychrophila TaxID=122355 RepID=UPI000A8FC2E7
LLYPEEVVKARKIRVFCEDDFAVHFAKKLIKSRKLLGCVEFHSSLNNKENGPGTSYSALRSLCINFPLLLERSLVIFDGDVPATVTDNIKNKDLYLTLPDAQGLAIERRIIVFVLELANEDVFFVKFKKERERFLGEFKAVGIKSLSIQDVIDEVKTPISQCKAWADRDKLKFKEFVTFYSGFAPGREEFLASFLVMINRINFESGMPALSL